MATDFKTWLKKEHYPISEVDPEDHRVTLWYEEREHDDNMEELLSLSFWELNSIWEGINLYIDLTKARIDKASGSGVDVRPLNRVMESTVMAKRKISTIRRYMANKHQHDELKIEVIETTLGADSERTTGENQRTSK